MTTAQEFWDRLFATKLDELNETEKLCFAVNWFLCEWANGFIEQYFYNSGGEQAAILERGLFVIGVSEAADVVREAQQVLFDNAEAQEVNLPWPLPDSKREQLRALDRRIAVVENEIWDRLESFVVAQGFYSPEET
jgi:hypothetical protein